MYTAYRTYGTLPIELKRIVFQKASSESLLVLAAECLETNFQTEILSVLFSRHDPLSHQCIEQLICFHFKDLIAGKEPHLLAFLDTLIESGKATFLEKFLFAVIQDKLNGHPFEWTIQTDAVTPERLKFDNNALLIAAMLSPEPIWLKNLDGEDGYLRTYAFKHIGEVAQKYPFLCTETIFKRVCAKLYTSSEHYTFVDGDALICISWMIKANPELLTRDFYVKLMNDSKNLSCIPSSFGYQSECHALGRIAEAIPKLAKHILPLVLFKLSAADTQAQCGAFKKIPDILRVDPDLLTERVLQTIMLGLKDGDDRIQSSALEAIGLLIEIKPELFNEKIVDAIIPKLDDLSTYWSAHNTVRQLIKTKPELLSSSLFNKIMALFTGKDSYPRYLALHTLIVFVKHRPEFLTQARFDKIIALMNHRDRSYAMALLENPSLFIDGKRYITKGTFQTVSQKVHYSSTEESDVKRIVSGALNAVGTLATLNQAFLTFETFKEVFEVLIEHKDPDIIKAGLATCSILMHADKEKIHAFLLEQARTHPSPVIDQLIPNNPHSFSTEIKPVPPATVVPPLTPLETKMKALYSQRQSLKNTQSCKI